MNNKTLRQLWLTIRVWLIAVAINAAFGAIFLDDFSITRYTGQIFITGLIWGCIFSLPVMVALSISTHYRSFIKLGTNI